jgi:predicted nucleotidyltransferase component of viral defense system
VKNKLFLGILNSQRQAILKALTLVFGKDYYLAGGTALALQIGHRESLDFDLFASREITFATKRKLVKKFTDYKPQTLVDTSDELSLVLGKNIKITLLNYFWDPIFPLIKPAGTIPLLSIKDIAATKAYALGRRGNYRDYFDLYVIIKNGHADIPGIVKWCQKKYGDVFSERMFLEQLTYTGDLETDVKLKFLGEKYISPKKLADFFKQKIRAL